MSKAVMGSSLALVALLAGTVAAQNGPPPGQPYQPLYGGQPQGPPPGNPPDSYYGEDRFTPERDGLMLGGSLGFGAVSFGDGNDESDAQAGGSASFYIGAFLNRNLAIMLDAQATAFSVGRFNDATFTSTITTAALKAYLTPQLWLKGGIGFAQLFYEDGLQQSESDPGFGLMAGIGFDIMARRKWALDLQFNAAVGSYDIGARDRAQVSNAAFMVGINFY